MSEIIYAPEPSDNLWHERDRARYPSDLMPFVQILLDHEDNLSDGFQYYSESISATLTTVAQEMQRAAHQSSWVKALVEALEALEKRMWRSGAGTVGFKWCAVCGRSDLDTGKIGHKSDCPFAALAAFEEGQ